MRKEPLARRVVSRLRLGEFQVFRHFCLVFQRASPPFRLYAYCTIFPALLQAFFADVRHRGAKEFLPSFRSPLQLRDPIHVSFFY